MFKQDFNLTKKTNKRVLVAMSGGVDSSVAAFLLKKQGYDVIGVTMCFGLEDSKTKRPSCCSISGIEDAKRVAEQLEIPHYTLSFGKLLKEKVIDEFVKEYLSGRTPNPCVRCNQYLKFGALMKKAKELNCDYLATGHYAKMAKDRSGRFFLKAAKDAKKDQTYFLFRMPKDKMGGILFPLGNLTKAEVRKIARENKLRVADKPGSQEICFVPNNDYRDFIRQRLDGKTLKPGPIIDTQGNIIGKHKGICFYTIGQREGLGIALGYRAYVIKIDARKNTIIVGREDELYSGGLIAADLSFIGMDFPKKSMSAQVKIRYNHKSASCRIIPLNKNQLKVEFLKPQRAVAPGQSAVFYDKGIVLGGGIIQKSFKTL
ncbi:MAG: tRNA 2-thiouridine(34) synthase MnmA [Candidatus Omnitrophica bacterium]|nr:tRNA 2-thiouridine(34) synthase MnmA [Candidatus Omnitrophota bacterium]MDD5352940.1 tRNA 2-thiouridine(34) synthase MnmA [Candidatus Omnitrophota bacterium]MDD5550539.1 tRNA 2-thiouridine(34) synthase MnmA [Candidatus Omnitrophota bacterium]